MYMSLSLVCMNLNVRKAVLRVCMKVKLKGIRASTETSKNLNPKSANHNESLLFLSPT